MVLLYSLADENSGKAPKVYLDLKMNNKREQRRLWAESWKTLGPVGRMRRQKAERTVRTGGMQS
jgi:hypothetical protein